MSRKRTEKILALVRRYKVLRPRDLSAHGIPREYLTRLHRQGLLERPTRGNYVLANAEPSELQSFVEASKRVPHGVICLLSALRFHELTTQAPFEVWLAIDHKAWLPKVEYPPLRIVRFPHSAMTIGIEEYDILRRTARRPLREPRPTLARAVTIRVTNPARTVVDCFKYRNKIGLDVALEALRDCWRQKKATMDELYRTAQALRMANVMRPYLESLA
jgi:predicted transcriptional regulator of viral defense system